MPADTALLAEVPFFQLLDDQERAELAAQLDHVSFSAGTPIFNYGDPGDSLYVLSTGTVEIFFRDDTGERIVLEVAKPGDIFGELSLLDGGPRSASAVALEDVLLLRLDRTHLNLFLQRRPAAAMDLLAATGRRLRYTADKLRHTASRNVNEEMEDTRTTVQKSADWIADASGSIPFLMMHIVFFAAWILLNVDWIPGMPRFDPFPYGLLTMVVSLEAIILSVFVLLSQNRQAAKDRIRGDIEYEVNLKAEPEIAHLHEKLDQLSAELSARLRTIEAGLGRIPESSSETRNR
jgi:CRP/FNR family transcriptional regulator, cyclic AMP receptor protein